MEFSSCKVNMLQVWNYTEISLKNSKPIILQNTFRRTSLAGYSRFTILYHGQITAFPVVDQKSKNTYTKDFIPRKSLETFF